MHHHGGPKARNHSCHTVRPWEHPLAHLSKWLDSVATGWPQCLQVLDAMVVLVRAADKFTWGQNINVKVPHAVTALTNNQGLKCLTNARITHYQGLLCENPCVGLESFLPTEEGPPDDDDCEEVTDEV